MSHPEKRSLIGENWCRDYERKMINAGKAVPIVELSNEESDEELLEMLSIIDSETVIDGKEFIVHLDQYIPAFCALYQMYHGHQPDQAICNEFSLMRIDEKVQFLRDLEAMIKMQIDPPDINLEDD